MANFTCILQIRSKEKNMSDSTSRKALSDLVGTEIDNDSLLEEAVRRARREANSDSVEFFRHGQFGSHNA